MNAYGESVELLFKGGRIMKRFLLVLGIVVVSINILVPATTFSELSDEEKQEVAIYKVEAQKDIGELKRGMKFYQKLSLWAMLLVILVGLFGITSSAVNNMKFIGASLTVTILGLTISAVTLVSNTVLPEDYRTYGVIAKDYKKGVEKIEDTLKDFDFQEYSDFEFQIEDIEATFDELEGKTGEIESHPVWFLLGPDEAEAARAKPSWTSQTPNDKKYYWSVGIGEGKSIRKAYNEAYDKAKKTLSQALKDKYKKQFTNSKKLDRFAKKMLFRAKVESTYYNRQNSRYRYYALLKLNKGTVRRSKKIYSR